MIKALKCLGCCLFLKTISLVILELFFSSDFLMLFVIHVKATKNSPPPKSVPEHETHSELTLLILTKLYAKIIPITIFFGPFQEYEAIYLAKLTIQMMSPLQLERSLSVPPGSTGERSFSFCLGVRWFLNKPLAAEPQTLGNGVQTEFKFQCEVFKYPGLPWLRFLLASCRKFEEDARGGWRSWPHAGGSSTEWLMAEDKALGCSENSCRERWRKTKQTNQLMQNNEHT